MTEFLALRPGHGWPRLALFVMRLDAAAGFIAAGLVAAVLGAVLALAIARALMVML